MSEEKRLTAPIDASDLKLTVPISKRRIADLLCSALEGGSNYWYQIEDTVTPPAGGLRAHIGTPLVKSVTVRPESAEVFRHIDYPLSEGGALLISDARAAAEDSVRTERLDLTSILKGLEVMSRKHPRHFGNFLAEKDDAETGDVFLQCCLFGETVYG